MKFWNWFLVVAAVAWMGLDVANGRAQGVAPTPPMGWNSWDAYGRTINETQFRANAEVLKHTLLPYGWNYAVIDGGWYFANPLDRPHPELLHFNIDRYGRDVPDPVRFPSAVVAGAPPPQASPAGPGVELGATGLKLSATGLKLSATIDETSFTALAAWVHAQGLNFGIHMIRGIPRASAERNLQIEGSSFHAQDAADTSDACPWDPNDWGVKDNAAGQAWYDSMVRLYSSWGVDMLKIDCIANNPYKGDEIRMIRRAIDKTGRPMVLSVSPGPTSLDDAAELGELATMWRISNDVWDVWDSSAPKFPQSIKGQFPREAAWAKYAKPNNWPDADMLPIGELRPNPGWGEARASRLTAEEQQTEMTLWAIARSPLIVGANLTLLDAPTLRLLTNRDLIAINQTARQSSEVLHDGDLIAWQALLPGGRTALAIFNVGDAPLKVEREFAGFGPGFGKKEWRVRDVWAGKDLGRQTRVSTQLAPHGCVLLMLR